MSRPVQTLARDMWSEFPQEIGPASRLVYQWAATIAPHRNGGHGVFIARLEEFAEACAMDVERIEKALERLRTYGLMAWADDWVSLTGTLPDVDEWAELSTRQRNILVDNLASLLNQSQHPLTLALQSGRPYIVEQYFRRQVRPVTRRTRAPEPVDPDAIPEGLTGIQERQVRDVAGALRQIAAEYPTTSKEVSYRAVARVLDIHSWRPDAPQLAQESVLYWCDGEGRNNAPYRSDWVQTFLRHLGRTAPRPMSVSDRPTVVREGTGRPRPASPFAATGTDDNVASPAFLTPGRPKS